MARSWGCTLYLGLTVMAGQATAHTMERSDLKLFETVKSDDTTHLRFVITPDFGPLTYETAIIELQTLCEMSEDVSGNVVVMIMDQPVPFGEPLGEIVTFAEIFTRNEAGCTLFEVPE